MATRITKERLAARAVLRKLKNPLYDTSVMRVGTAESRLAFFQAPQGQPIMAAGAMKTEADTNLQQAGQLGRPTEFDLYALQMELQQDADDLTIYDDYLALYEEGLFSFRFGSQRPWLEVPVTQIPNGLSQTGAVATADAGTPTAYAFVNNGEASCKDFCDMTVGGDPIPIASAENFGARLEFAAAVTITSAVALRVRVHMLGILYSSL